MKKKGFDYIGELKERAERITPPELREKLDYYDGNFSNIYHYHHKEENPDKIKNPRILFQYERGGEENSYINIFLGDYDNMRDERGKKQEPELIGYYYIKDYFQETRALFDFMYYLQKAAEDLADDLYFEKI
jgi:hypothetical protein